jgi:hypothetical protein
MSSHRGKSLVDFVQTITSGGLRDLQPIYHRKTTKSKEKIWKLLEDLLET